MRNIFLLLLLLCSCWVCSQTDTSAAQRTPQTCEIKLKDGSVYKGKIVQQNDSLIVLKAKSGVIVHIPKDHISEVDFVKTHPSDSSASLVPVSIGHRYYVASSSAFLFKKRQTFASSSYLVFFNFNYAFTSHFSLGISSSVIGAPIGIQAKANFEVSHKIHLGFEGIAGGMMYLNSRSIGTGGVMKLTWGDERRHFTFFAGYFDAHYWWTPSRRRGRAPRGSGHYIYYNSPFAGLAAQLPMSQNMSFTTEAFAFPNISIYTLSAAIRTVKRERFSFVFGVQVIANTTVDISRAFTFPYLGAAASF